MAITQAAEAVVVPPAQNTRVVGLPVAPVLAVEPAEPPKKAKRKAKAKASVPAVTPDPLKARPAKRAKAGARARKGKSARTAKARVGAPLGEPWGRHTWLKRWTRERQRSPLIRRAVPGSVLTVERMGKTYQAKVFKGYYTINGKDCATLCEAAKIATGTTNWSAVKFWGLDKAKPVPPKSAT
jgi:hypothetical protein